MASRPRTGEEQSEALDLSPSEGAADRCQRGRDLPPLLPTDLSSALARLPDVELERLSRAVNAEYRRQWPQAKERQSPSTKASGLGLPQAKVNAIRAALKVGVKPTVVARQFGVSPAEIRKALDSE